MIPTYVLVYVLPISNFLDVDLWMLMEYISSSTDTRRIISFSLSTSQKLMNYLVRRHRDFEPFDLYVALLVRVICFPATNGIIACILKLLSWIAVS